MTPTAKEDKSWSEKNKMEGDDDSLRTLDCLRGRLLAERQASKVAKEEADLMGNKIIEIENKLRQETKLRQKAEKKLKFLMKKLESLKISPTLLSNSSEISGFSSTSSSTGDSAFKFQDSQEMKENHSSDGSTTQDTLDSDSVSNLKDSVSDKSSNHFTPSSQSCSNLEAPVEMKKDSRTESDNEDNVDNSLALVPVNLPAPNKTSELMIVNKSVSEVLDVLRHAREKIQSSIERRHMITVGPT